MAAMEEMGNVGMTIHGQGGVFMDRGGSRKRGGESGGGLGEVGYNGRQRTV